MASVQVKNDFRATCSLLEDARKASAERHQRPAEVLPFSESRLYSLASGQSLTGPPAASGDLYIGHGAANSASARVFAIKSRR